MKTLISISTGVLLAVFSSQIMARIEVATSAEIEVTETNAQGEQTVVRTAATSVVPGTEVIYTITSKNTGAAQADHIVVTNPVPAQTVYVEDSASGHDAAITFSVDGGKTYDSAGKLTVTDANEETRAATAEDYTHVRWTFGSSLEPGQEVPVTYRARVK